MQKKLPFIALALLAVCGTAQADLKVVQTTSVDSPQLKAYMETMTPAERAQMAKSENPLFQTGPRQTVLSVQGSRTRLDLGNMTFLTDTAARRIETINRGTRTYSVQPYRAPATGQIAVTVKDTGQTKVIAGHLCHHYLSTATLASQPGSVIQGDIWAAADIPQPAAFSTGSGPFSVLQSLFRKIKGFPLKSALTLTGSPLGNTTFITNIVSVSKAPLPASLFAVPVGYTKTAAEARG